MRRMVVGRTERLDCCSGVYQTARQKQWTRALASSIHVPLLLLLLTSGRRRNCLPSPATLLGQSGKFADGGDGDA